MHTQITDDLKDSKMIQEIGNILRELIYYAPMMEDDELNPIFFKLKQVIEEYHEYHALNYGIISQLISFIEKKKSQIIKGMTK